MNLIEFMKVNVRVSDRSGILPLGGIGREKADTTESAALRWIKRGGDTPKFTNTK